MVFQVFHFLFDASESSPRSTWCRTWDAQRALIARASALRAQSETAKLRNGSRSAAARGNGTGPAPEEFPEKIIVRRRLLNFTSIMLPFDPRSADSGERAEGSDGATAPHGVIDTDFGQFRRAILERRARALRREQPRSSCPTMVAHLVRESLGRVCAPARDSVAAAAPFARALPVAAKVHTVTDPRVAYTTSESTGLHRLHRPCNPVDSSALPVARAISVESRARPPIPEAIPVCRGNTNPRASGRRADSHESPAVAPFARVDPSPGLAVTRPESGRSSEAHDRTRPANETTARQPDRGDGIAARDARASRRAVRRSRDEHDRSPTSGTKRGVSLSERSASANGRKRAKSASEPGTGTVFVPCDSLRSNSFRSETSGFSALAEDAGRTPSQPLVPVCNLRGASFDSSRWRLDEGARDSLRSNSFRSETSGFRRSPKTRGERRLSRSCPSATSAALRSTVHDCVWTRARATRYVRTRFGRKLRGFRRSPKTRGERRLSRSCPSATSAALRSTVHDCVWTRARARARRTR